MTIETCDEIGTIIPNSERFLGSYVGSQFYGYGDNGTRCDTFINDDGQNIHHYLDYDGTTRYREITRLIDQRINYIKLAEGIQNETNMENKNEHINKYILNPCIIKEVCSFKGNNLL